MRVEDREPGSEDVGRWATRTSNQQPQPQDPTPPGNRWIMLRTRIQRREARDRIGEGGEQAKKSKKL